MPTILLQEIIDILNSWRENLGTQIEQALESLSSIEDDTGAIKDYINSILSYVSSIATDTANISTSTDSIDTKITTVNNVLADINNKLSTANNHLNNISSNTGSIVTPISNIKSNSDTLVQNSNSISSNVSSISNNIGTISANTGASATYTEQTATNTGNIMQKVTTMASDTTQLRADNQNILDVLDSINDAVQQIPHTVQASDVLYDPSTSGLIATNVQDAIDALSSDLSDKVDTSDFNASVMPISDLDSTATKTYIDNKLSEKEDTLSTISGTITANTSGGWGVYGQLQKYGNVVSFYIDANKSSALSSGWNTIATLQSGFRPTYNFDFAMIDPGSDFASEGKVNTDGTIQVYKNANSTTRIRAQATFII